MLIRPALPGRTRSTLAGRAAFTLVEVLVVVAILLIIAGVGTFAAMNQLANSKIKQAELKASTIERAVKAYALQNEGNYPDNLNLLVQAPNGKPLLEGGQAAIVDPWGKPYQMSLVADNTGNQRVVISTTDENGNAIQWPKQ